MISTTWLIAGGVGLATVLGLLWATSGTASAAEKKTTNTEKNKAAGGAAFAAGKAAGFTQGGIDAATTGSEDIEPAASADAKAASAKTDDPPSFLKGYAEGYPAGFASSAAAKKLGVTYAVTMEEPPPPPDAPPAAPPGKPSTYSSAPNAAGFNLAYGEGHTYGKNNALDYAPGSGQANGLKTSDHYAASTKFDADQMILWSSSWDKGYQRGWDQGQAEYHAGVGGGGGGITKDLTVDTTDEGEGFLSTTGVAGSPRNAPLLSVGTALGVGSVGTILSVGYEPATSTLLRVGGVRVLGIRGAYSPMIVSRRGVGPTSLAPKKVSPTMAKTYAMKCYDDGFNQGRSDAEQANAGSVVWRRMIPMLPGDAECEREYNRGYDAGFKRFRRASPGVPLAISFKDAHPPASSRASNMPMRGVSPSSSMSMFNYGG